MIAGLLLIALLIPATSLAENAVLRVAFNELPPWKGLDENGTAYGIDISFLQCVATRMGLEIEYKQYPFNRCLYLLEHGEADLMTGVLRRPNRETYLYFIDPPYKNYSDKVFYVRAGDEDTIREYRNLSHHIIGARLGGKYFPRFDRDNTLKKDLVKSFELSLKMLIAGRIDATIHTETTGDYEVRRLGLEEKVSKARYAYRKQQDVYLALSKKSPMAHRVDEFNTVVADLVREGVFERIKTQFISATTSTVVPQPE